MFFISDREKLVFSYLTMTFIISESQSVNNYLLTIGQEGRNNSDGLNGIDLPGQPNSINICNCHMIRLVQNPFVELEGEII